MTPGPQGRLLITVGDDPRAAVVHPTGVLDLAACATLREALLKCSADEPPGIVVDLSGLAVRSATLLSVFPAMARRIQEWPGIPLLLAAPDWPVALMLQRTGVPRFVGVYPTRSAALAAVRATPLRRRRDTRLAAEPASAARARRLVDGACREWGLDALRDDALLITSELVSNVLRHTRSDPVLRLEWTGERFMVAVRDTDPTPPQPQEATPSHLSGRGLRLVARTATYGGYAPTPSGGKVVWASILRPAERAGGTGTRDLPQPRAE